MKNYLFIFFRIKKLDKIDHFIEIVRFLRWITALKRGRKCNFKWNGGFVIDYV
jgi:hypothetical protein